MLLLKLFLVVCHWMSFAENTQVSIKLGSWSYTVSNPNTNPTDSSTSGFGAYSLELGHGLSDNLLLKVGLNLIMSDFISGSSGSGFDMGVSYYPFTDAGTGQVQSERSVVVIQEQWRPYLGVALRQRSFSLVFTSTYIGPGVQVGVDYSIGPRTFLNFEARYDMMYGSGDVKVNQTNMMVGFGYEL